MIGAINIKDWQCLRVWHNRVLTSSPSLQIFCHSSESPLRNETVHLIIDVNDKETQLSLLTDEKGEAHFTLDTTSWNSTMVSLRVSTSH